MRKRGMGDEDENDVEDTSGYEKSGVRLAWLGWEDLVSVLLHAGSGVVPAVSGMVNCLSHKILLSPSFICPISSTITSEHEVKSSLSISPCHDQESTCRWTTMVMLRCGSVTLGAAL